MAISTNLHPDHPTRSIPGLHPQVENRMIGIRILTGIICGLAAIGFIGAFILYFSHPTWPVIGLGLVNAATAGFCLLALFRLYPNRVVNGSLLGICLLFGLASLATSALLSNLGFLIAIVYLILALIVSSTIGNDRLADLAIGAGILFAAGSALLNDFSPFQQVTIEWITIITPAMLGVLFMIYMTMMAMQFVSATMRIRLVTVFLAIVIVSLAILAVIQSQFTFNVLSREVSQALILASKQTASGIDQFITTSQQSIQEAARLDIFPQYLALSRAQRKGSPEDQEMRLTLRVMDTNQSNNTIYLSSYALLDAEGLNVYDTLLDRYANQLSPESLQAMGIDLRVVLPGEGVDESQQDYFKIPMQKGTAYISPLEVTSSTRGFFYISAPVKNSQGQVLGVLRARFDGLLLQDLVKQYNGLLTTRSYAILVDENNIRLADAFMPSAIYKTVAPLPIAQVANLQSQKRLPDLPNHLLSTNFPEFDQILDNYQDQNTFTTHYSLVYNDDQHSEVGAIATLRSMPWRVAYIRADYSVEEIRQSQRRLASLVSVSIAAVIGILAVGTAQLLSSPIIRLTQTAQSISAGNLEAHAEADSSDEFGLLGAAFNSMTSQTRALIAQLEERVKTRTQEIEDQNKVLADRARQLQTVSEVARQIVTAQELETLLVSVTRLVSDRFGFYHVGIFLIDQSRTFAVLRAANSEGGQKMLARNHSLQVGKVGIVGYVTGTGQPRIATDVGSDATYFNNPDLPNTRSEMALPLKVGGQVIGALDIQSTEPDAFYEGDIDLFNTLSDQIAVAIHNNQLYIETLEALDEAQTLHRQYLRGEWAKDIAQRKVLGYLYNPSGISPQQIENPLWKNVFSNGEPVYAVLPSNNGSPDHAVMAVPINIRGETIGVIHVQDQGENRMWSEDEINVVNGIASQVAVALENARLFENTVRRAEREKTALQITAKIRSTNDPEEMMRIAIGELQQALHATRTQIYLRGEDPSENQAAE